MSYLYVSLWKKARKEWHRGKKPSFQNESLDKEDTKLISCATFRMKRDQQLSHMSSFLDYCFKFL